MTRTQKRKTDQRTRATRLALIEAGEELFAVGGFEQVSTRQIGAAIGSSNTAVVAYHFGTKEGLKEAIYRHRLPGIDRRRRELLDEADARGLGHDLPTILAGIWLPLFEQVNARGLHSYARFLGKMISEGSDFMGRDVISDFPASAVMIDRISDQLPFLPYAERGLWAMRWTIATRMVLHALEYIDMRELGASGEARMFFADAVEMARAALVAPVADEAARA